MSAVLFFLLFHQMVTVPHGCNLRQMGDADDLTASADAGHLFPDHLRHASADAGIDFVKDHCAHIVLISGNGLKGEHHARKLTTRRSAGQRLERFAGIGGDQKSHAVQSRGRIVFFRLIESGNRGKIDVEPRFCHTEILQLFLHGCAEALRCVLPQLMQAHTGIVKFAGKL